MNNFEEKRKDIKVNTKKNNASAYKTHKELEAKLRKMGIEPPISKPRISDPAHNRSFVFK